MRPGGQRRLSNSAYACLKQLRKDETLSHLATAFDSARGS